MDIYKKHHSFKNFYSSKMEDVAKIQKERAIILLKNTDDKILKNAKKCLENDNELFSLTPFIAEEMSTIEDDQILNYLYHRYRYDVFPQKKIIDEYPPYLQIEPSSICNFKCMFCYQTHPYFKENQNLGTMDFLTFKKIIDEIEGKIQFISLASRGEPLVCRDIDKMLRYCNGKFLGLKVNTNASLLNKDHSRALLSGGVKTIVFSVDAHCPELYDKYRKKGYFEKVYSNITKFNEIKSSEFPDSNVITRISGVKVEPSQSMPEMIKKWSNLVDQITYVNYNPWEDIYSANPNSCSEACSDLWRRLFIWYNGDANPCDTDFKSSLSVGNINTKSVCELWNSTKMNDYRSTHLSGRRQFMEPCRRCSVI